jgi:hypothetical protein
VLRACACAPAPAIKHTRRARERVYIPSCIVITLN